MNAAQLDHTAKVLAEMLTFKQPSDAVLSAYFREHKKLGRQDRHEIAETAFAALRHYQKISTALRRPHAQPRKAALAALVLGRSTNISQIKDLLDEEETEFLGNLKARKTEFSDGLNTDLAEAWRSLYLGEVEPGRFAAVVRLNGMTDEAAVRAVAQHISGVHWADKRAHLNELFHHTRNQAAWLKLASYALAWLLLWKMFGFKRGSKILAVPLAAAICTVAVLGLAGIPVSLFAMFGLLLVSAIGVDYAVYAATAHHSAPAKLGGMLLAAATTAISFALLAISSTPAVAAFGMTVTIGVAFNIWLAGTLLKN